MKHCISAHTRLTDAIHRSQSYFVVLIAILLSILDILSAIRRFIIFLRRSSGKSFENFWKTVIRNEEERLVFASEYIGLVEEAEDPSKPSYDSVELQSVRLSDENHWPKHQQRHPSEQIVFGTGSPNDDTLHDSKGHQSSLERRGVLGRIGHAAIAITERALVVGGFGQLLIGIATYTGRCHNLSFANC